MKRVAVLLLALEVNLAHAEAGRLSVPNNATRKQECGSCHIPYPPQLLSAENWQRLMGSPDRHFGVNATLDAGDNRKILNFLEHNAGSGARYSADSLRISDTPGSSTSITSSPTRNGSTRKCAAAPTARPATAR